MARLFSCVKRADIVSSDTVFRHRSSASTMKAFPGSTRRDIAGWNRRWKGFKKSFTNLFSCFNNAGDSDKDLEVEDWGANDFVVDVTQRRFSSSARSSEEWPETIADDLEVEDWGADDLTVDVTQNRPSSTSAKSSEDWTEITEINSCCYEVGKKIGEGGCGSVYEGIRSTDDLKVALKFANKDGLVYINIDGYSEAIPVEIGLHILATKGPKVPQIIELLDWQEKADFYVMVLERPMPCQELIQFLEDRYTDATMEEEEVAAVIMQQVIFAAQTCCQRGVLHGDIKLENLLINPEILEVKLIDFGCGELLKSSAYTSCWGTEGYWPPEFDTTGEYQGNPATVWSLGIVFFLLLSDNFPESEVMDELNNYTWFKDGLSRECCELLCSLLQKDPEKRLDLEKIHLHKWFKCLRLTAGGA